MTNATLTIIDRHLFCWFCHSSTRVIASRRMRIIFMTIQTANVLQEPSSFFLLPGCDYGLLITLEIIEHPNLHKRKKIKAPVSHPLQIVHLPIYTTVYMERSTIGIIITMISFHVTNHCAFNLIYKYQWVLGRDPWMPYITHHVL